MVRASPRPRGRMGGAGRSEPTLTKAASAAALWALAGTAAHRVEARGWVGRDGTGGGGQPGVHPPIPHPSIPPRASPHHGQHWRRWASTATPGRRDGRAQAGPELKPTWTARAAAPWGAG